MTTTQQLRDWWAPPCKGPFVKVDLHGDGAVSVRTDIVAAVAALDARLKAHQYPTRQADTGAYNCRPITGGTKYSLHAYGIALDINWKTNPYGPVLVTDMPAAMVADIKAIRTRNGRQVWRWGGNYAGNKDAMHFEICCSPADLATGIAAPQEDDMPSIEDIEKLLDRKLDEKLGTNANPGENPGPDTVIGRFLARIKEVQGNLADLIRSDT